LAQAFSASSAIAKGRKRSNSSGVLSGGFSALSDLLRRDNAENPRSDRQRGIQLKAEDAIGKTMSGNAAGTRGSSRAWPA
jgi:hypothetical protein